MEGLHDGDQAKGEQRQTAYIGGRQDQSAAIDGFASPDGLGRSGDIHDQLVARQVRVRLREAIPCGVNTEPTTTFCPE